MAARRRRRGECQRRIEDVLGGCEHAADARRNAPGSFLRAFECIRVLAHEAGQLQLRHPVVAQRGFVVARFFQEARFGEIPVVERSRPGRRTRQRASQLQEGNGHFGAGLVLLRDGEVDGDLRFRHELLQRQAGRQAVDEDAVEIEGGERELPRFDAGAKAFLQERQAVAQGGFPAVHDDAEDLDRAAHLGSVAEAVRQRQRQLPELVADVVPAGAHVVNAAVERVREGGIGGRAVQQREIGRPGHEEDQHVRTAEVGRRAEDRDQAHAGADLFVLHLRLVDEVLDPATAQVAHDRRGLGLDHLRQPVQRPLAPEDGESFAAPTQRARPVARDRGRQDAQAIEVGLGHLGRCMGQRGLDQVLRHVVFAREIGAFGEFAMDRERDPGPIDPRLLAEVAPGHHQVFDRGPVRRGSLGLPPGGEVQVDQRAAFGFVVDVGFTQVELVDDLEQDLRKVVSCLCQQPEADGMVQGLPVLLVQQAIGRLLHAVVDEPESGLGRIGSGNHQSVLDGRPQSLDHGGPGETPQLGERAEVEAVTDAGTHLQVPFRRTGQTVDGLDHEVEHVVRDRRLLDRRLVPGPAMRWRVKAEQVLRVHRVQEAPHEEGIAGRLADEEVGQRPHPSRVFAERFGGELRHGLGAERLQVDLLDADPGCAQRREEEGQGVGRAHLVVAIGGDEQDVVARGVADPLLEKLQRGRVGPLQVVQEDHQGVIRLREDAQEAREQRMEPVPRFDGTDLGHRCLRTEDVLELRHEGDQELPVRRDRVLDLLPPALQRCFGLREQLPHHASKRLRQAGERDAALKLVELARGVEALPRGDLRAQAFHQGGLPDAGSARDQQELPGARTGLRESVGEVLQLLIAAIELAGDPQPLRDFAGRKLERFDAGRADPLFPDLA